MRNVSTFSCVCSSLITGLTLSSVSVRRKTRCWSRCSVKARRRASSRTERTVRSSWLPAFAPRGLQTALDEHDNLAADGVVEEALGVVHLGDDRGARAEEAVSGRLDDL